MATKYYNKPSNPKIKWEDIPTVSDEENDTFSPADLAATAKKSSKYDTNLSDAEQARRITKALVPAKKATPKYDTNLSDAEQSARITKALVPAKKATPKYDTNLSDAEQSARITKALVPNTEDADRQKRINANRAYFEKRGAFKDNEHMKKGGSVKAKSKSSCMKTGGMVKSSASRGDGIAQRGKTRGKMC